MVKQLYVWQLIAESLQQNTPVMLLYVLHSKGSSPGRQGFSMAVNLNGQMEGSIGGGIMEHKLVEMAKEALLANQHEILIRKQVHDKKDAKNQSGMICSGEQTIFLYNLNRNDKIAIDSIIDTLQQNKNGLLQLSSLGLSFSETTADKDFYFIYQSDNYWKYEERMGYKDHVYIIGGGHCSLALSKIMSMLDFCIHIYDNRAQLNTFEHNEFAHEKVLLKDYTELKDIIPSDNNYIIVMTMGYRSDDTVVRALTGKKFKYFGILGSKKKIEKMFQDYNKEGLSVEFLNKIRAPVGLQVNSQTPEEIAISIAAEIINVKNNAFDQDP